VAGSDPSSSSTTSGTSGTSTDPLAQEQTFLQLLVAQVQNQDPMDPTADPTEYVTQLAQFSSLEQLTGMHSDLDTLVSATQTPSAAAAPSTQENN
jgi:flagellar basal-body rod modification protein FlgD